jgi:hypothetical protein
MTAAAINVAPNAAESRRRFMSLPFQAGAWSSVVAV